MVCIAPRELTDTFISLLGAFIASFVFSYFKSSIFFFGIFILLFCFAVSTLFISFFNPSVVSWLGVFITDSMLSVFACSILELSKILFILVEGIKFFNPKEGMYPFVFR